ncbi:hypothetical protein B0H10DRAFT_1766319, partial [Mycena sp. CBHHK59/15]
ASTKLDDDFLRVPKLEVTGTNWVVYKDRFIWPIDVRGLTEHIEDGAGAPADPINRAPDADPLTAAQKKQEEEWKKELKTWKQGEAVVKQQIAGTIPYSLFMKIRNKSTALEIWKALGDEFQKKSRMVSVDL